MWQAWREEHKANAPLIGLLDKLTKKLSRYDEKWKRKMAEAFGDGEPPSHEDGPSEVH
jgi:ribosome-associated translation inhibitor RaiA